MQEIYDLAHDLRINCVTKELVRERLSEIENPDSLRMVAESMIEDLKPKMAYAGVRAEMLDVTIDLVSKTLDLEFLVQELKKYSH